jgi:apolipoprotein N-acyltransferase
VFTPSRALSILLAAGGGWVTTLAYPNVGWWPTAFVGVALLILATGRDSARWAALVGLVWGGVFFGVHIWWAAVATALVPWLALTVLEAAFVAGACAGWVWVRRIARVGDRAWFEVLGFGFVFVAAEQLRSVFPFGGFPWGLLAFSQASSPLGRLAWLGGQVAVSLAVCVGAGALAAAASRRRSRAWVGAVQGNVSEPGLGSFENRGEVLANHVAGTLALTDQVDPGYLDVVLWPENGSDLDPQQVRSVASDIDAAARAAGAPILVGAQEFPDEGGRYNVLLLWEPGHGVSARYAKQHPAPFGEYMPLRSLLRVFSSQVDRISIDMLAGREVAVIDLPSARLGREVPLGTLICFEVAYEPLVYQAVSSGAEVLVIPTNNASFGFTPESTQQLAMSRLRALETGRATVQVSTVGVSGVIAPDGSLLASTELFTADQLIADLPLRTSLTPAVRVGAAPGWIVVTVAMAGIGAGVLTTVRSGMQTGRRMRRPVAMNVAGD